MPAGAVVSGMPATPHRDFLRSAALARGGCRSSSSASRRSKATRKEGEPWSSESSEILKILPHRYPFLLVDRIVAFEKGKSIVGIKNVTFNEEFFQGHFPGNPVMPGVLIVEAMAQVGRRRATTCRSPEGAVRHMYLSGVDRCKFRRPVVPGDQLRIEVEYLDVKPRLVQVPRRGPRSPGSLCAEAELFSVLVERT